MANNPENGGEIGNQPSFVAPFSIRILERASENNGDNSPSEGDQLYSLLPASYRTRSDDLAATCRDVMACLKYELDLQRLTRIHSWLWVAGRPMPPRPLHYQLLLGREICVAERLDMHLVWTTGRMFFKPIPRFLLEPRFWAKYMCCAHESGCSDGKVDSEEAIEECKRGLRKRALGLLFSYAALISHESDLRIAKEQHLLPAEVQWPAWRKFVEQLDTENIYPRIDPRFHHGELRLSRLNKIYLWQSPLGGYMPQWNQYSIFFRDNFALLASATVYIAIVLTAMQVGLATDLRNVDAFQSVSYGFTVFSILGPLVATSLIILAFCCIFAYNWVQTVNYRKRRLASIGVKIGAADPAA